MSFHGITAVVELPSLPGWDPRTGRFVTRRWRGSPTAVAAQAAVLEAAGIRYRIEGPDDGSYQVVLGEYGSAATDSPSVAISDVWDLIGEDLEKSIWDHPKWLAIVAKAPEDTRAEYTAKVRAWIEALGRGERTWTDDDGTEIALSQAEILENAAVLFSLAPGQQEYIWLTYLIQDYAAGVEAWPTSRWVLRRTLTVTEGTTIRLNNLNVGKVTTLGAINAENGIDAEVLPDCPDTGYWVKRTPQKTNVGSGKYTLTYEWWHTDDFSRFVYDQA